MRNLLSVEIIHKLEQECFDEPWSLEMVRAQLNSKNSATVIKTANGVPVGFATGARLDGDAELYRIAVLPKFRGQGLAREILAQFLSRCGGDVFLEVRAKNTAAIGLYEGAGFVQIGCRKGYYGDDDAVVYKFSRP
ncbi:MAG: GNAT family N-acetyltransferase [Oscillospiraceae bacterium]|nr:GNAT family N-acetyltransferase [Oscillospiraceae bacterium]